MVPDPAEGTALAQDVLRGTTFSNDAEVGLPGVLNVGEGSYPPAVLQPWNSKISVADNTWHDICYGNGLFVAVGYGLENRIMTSPDGVTWTIRTAPSRSWQSVCYGNGLFVAVAGDGSDADILTSPDGITWTYRTPPVFRSWQSVCYGNGLFVAVADSGTGNRVMTSPDGINWTIGVSAADNAWTSVCYGNGLFVAVG